MKVPQGKRPHSKYSSKEYDLLYSLLTKLKLRITIMETFTGNIDECWGTISGFFERESLGDYDRLRDSILGIRWLLGLPTDIYLSNRKDYFGLRNGHINSDFRVGSLPSWIRTWYCFEEKRER